MKLSNQVSIAYSIVKSLDEDVTRDEIIDNSIVDEEEDPAVDKAKIADRIISLKSTLASIQAKKKLSDYNKRFDSTVKAQHNQKLLEIPKKIKELQGKM